MTGVFEGATEYLAEGEASKKERATENCGKGSKANTAVDFGKHWPMNHHSEWGVKIHREGLGNVTPFPTRSKPTDLLDFHAYLATRSLCSTHIHTLSCLTIVYDTGCPIPKS